MPLPAFLSRLLGRVERRWMGGWGLALDRVGGGTVSPREAEGLSAVLACVELISGSIASLPASLVIDTPDGRAPAPLTAPAWRLLTRPNAQQSWPALASWLTGQILLHGNGVAWVATDARGAVSALTPIPWPWLQPHVIAGGDGPRLVFDVVQTGPEAALLQLPRRLLDDDVMHVRSRSDFGIVGRSVLSRASGPVREGTEIAQLAASNWRNGMRPSAVLTAPNYLSEQQRLRYGDDFEARFTSSINAGRMPLLEGGWKLERAALSSVDAEFLNTRHFNVSEIARCFGVPEVLIQTGQRVVADLAPFLSAFATQALLPVVTAIEGEFDNSVLPPGMHLVLDTTGLMRGSFSAVTAALCAATQSGITTANDARRAMGLPPLDGGDVLRVSGAPSWPADAPGMPHLGPSPGPRGDAPAEPGTHQGHGAKGNGAMPTMQ
jgi:HK97 family phage portal protein